MDSFFQPGGIFGDSYSYPYNIRIPYAGQIPPPGFTLVHDSINHVQLFPAPYVVGHVESYSRRRW